MLQTISLYQLSSDRLLNYANVYIPLLKDSAFKNEFLDIIIQKLENSLKEFEDSRLQAERALLTKQIAEADRQQDVSFLILRSKIEAAKWESIDEEKSDAGLLMEAIDDIGYSLHNFSYVREEAALHHLLNSFENDSQLQTAINNLNLQDQVKNLNDKFMEFKRLRKLRRDQSNNAVDDKSYNEVRKELIGHIRSSSSLIDIAFNNKSEDTGLKALVEDINRLNNSERALIMSKESRKANAQAAEVEEALKDQE